MTCDDGRRGIFAGESLIWADGTRSNLVSPHPSVIIGNKSSVVIGPGVFAGNGKGGHVPMENPSAPSKARLPGAGRRVVLSLLTLVEQAARSRAWLRALHPSRARPDGAASLPHRMRTTGARLD